MVLSDAVIKLQQNLSESFGIPTFTLTGDISTVPTTRPVSTRINVGVGKFGGETLSSFTTKLNQSISRLKQTGGTIGSTKIKKITKNINPQETNAAIDDTFQAFDFTQTLREGFSGLPPTVLLIGVGLLLLTVLKR